MNQDAPWHLAVFDAGLATAGVTAPLWLPFLDTALHYTLVFLAIILLVMRITALWRVLRGAR